MSRPTIFTKEELTQHRKERLKRYNSRPESKLRKSKRAKRYNSNPETKLKNRERHKKWILIPENKEKEVKRLRDLRLNNLEYYTNYKYEYDLKAKYNITIDDYNRMLEKQNNVCYICEKPDNIKRLSVDHDHVSKKVRGLLCHRCNTKLGWYENHKDNIHKYLDNA